MKKIAFSFLTAMGIAVAFADEPFAAVKAIVGRLAGGYNGAAAAGADTAKANAAMDQFVFVQDNAIAAGAGKVEAAEGKIKITASDASGASFALGQYLRHTAKVHISWCGNRAIENYPLPTATTTYTPAIPVRFAYNYCTLSYTMAFWSANEWREEIDRLALSGYNVALVLQGLQEAWRVTLESVKKANGDRVYSNEQIMKYVSDEAAQAWWHMGNLEGLGGPLGGEKGDYAAPDAYEKFTVRCQKDAELGQYIYAEMMKLGIQPSVQSFVGLVPDCSNQVLVDGVAENGTRFGDADNWGIIDEGSWLGYTRPDVVNPLNIAFDEMSKAWYGALVNIYKPETHGYTSFMGGDLFHEGGKKGSLTDADLANIAKKIQDTQAQYFGKNGNVVTWVIQSWQGSPYQGIRNGVYADRALIQLLDKDMSQRGSINADYWKNADGTSTHIPWIWVEVLNFGGNTGMHGGARRFRNLAKIGTASGHRDSFMGYGILSEGLETNPMMYDMFNDAFTREVGLNSSLDTDAKMTAWIHDYLVRRYGEANVCPDLEAAFQTLVSTAYDCSKYQEGCIENILCASPSYSVANVSVWGPETEIEYDTLLVQEAARGFLAAVEAKPTLKDLDTFKYDFVELFLQTLGERARVINKDCATSAKKRAEFLGLLDFAEKITACSPRWRLDWHEARTLTTCPDGAGVRGYRRMVTTWADGFDAGKATGLREYAHRGYSGLFKDYYTKRWQWFFDVTDGKISQSQFIQNQRTLGETFPTAVLKPTPAGDMVQIAKEILDFLNPPALVWNGETDSSFEGMNWTDGTTGGTVGWRDGCDVTIAGAPTITAAGKVTVGDLSIEADVVKSAATGYIGTTDAVATGWTDVTLEDLANKFEIRGTMNGGWVAEGTAIAYNKTRTDDKLTVQMKLVDGGYIKATALEFTVEGDQVKVKALWSRNRSDNALTDDFTNLGNSNGNPIVATGDNANGYGITSLQLCRSSNVTLAGGPYVIEGSLLLGNNDLTFTGVAAVHAVVLDALATSGVIHLDAERLTVGSVSIEGTQKLVLAGKDGTLAAGKVTLPKAALAQTFYVGPDGVEQKLVMAADGTVKSAFRETTCRTCVTGTPTKTGIRGYALSDLATCEFTGTMGGLWVASGEDKPCRGYQVALNDEGTELTVQMQLYDSVNKSVTLTFTVDSEGEICVKGDTARHSFSSIGSDATTSGEGGQFAEADNADGYAVLDYTIRPAVAQVVKTKSNYATLADAIAAMNGSVVSIIADTTTGAISTYPIKFEVAKGVELKVTAGDFLGWDKAWELHVKGTVNLGANQLSYGEAVYTAQKIYLYEGGAILNTSGHGFSIFENSTIYVKQGADKEPALIGATLQARKNITIDVEEGATAIVETNVMDKDGLSGTATAKIIKTGAGELVFNGFVQSENVSVELNGGILTRALAEGEVFNLTLTSGTANITSADTNYEVILTGETAEKAYTSTPIAWLVYVTEAGVTGQNGAGKSFRTYNEAVAYALAEQAKTPNVEVIMWTVVANREILAKDDGLVAAIKAKYGNDTTKTLDDVIAKSPDGEKFLREFWNTEYVDPDDLTKAFYPMGSATEWTTSVKGKAYPKKDADISLTAESKVVFDQNFGPIYINTDVAPRQMIVQDHATLKVGYWNNTTSLPSGMAIDIADGATVQFDNWADGKQVVIPSATVNGEGSFTFGPTITSASYVTIGTLAGTGTLTVPSAVTVEVTGSIANPIAGAGTIKIAGEQQLKFVADATVKVIYENAQADGYFMNTATVQNPDGTVTRTYGLVEAADIQAFDTSWTYYYTGATADWNTIGNWSKVEGKTLVPLTGTKLPATTGSNMWEPILVNGNLMTVEPDEDGYKHVAVDALEGWGFRIGAVNGAAVDIVSMVKMQCDNTCLTTIRVDATSKVTIDAVSRNNGTDAYYYIAAEDGLVLPRTMENNGKYYLTGNGSVKYNGNFDSGTHTFKHAEIEIGTGDYKAYKTKKLISLKSGATNTATFTIDEGAVVDSTSAEGVTLTKKDTAITAEDAVGTYYLRKADDGIYLDYVAKSEARPLLVWDTTKGDWDASTQALIAGTTFSVVPTKDDTVVFDKNFTTLGTKHFFILHNTTTLEAKTACRKMIVRDGVTLHLGFANTSCNIPNDFTITLEGSAKLVLSVWGDASTKAIKLGSNVTINGGSVEIDTTRATALTVGDLYGTTTLTIPENYTVTAQGDVGVTLTGAGTLKAANLGVIKGDADWTGTVDATAVSVGGAMGQKMAGVVTTVNDDGTKTIEIVECANEAIMTNGGKFNEATFVNPLGNTITWTQIQAMTFKPKIILNKNDRIYYLGDTTGYNLAIRDEDIYCMVGGPSAPAFGDSTVEVQSGSLNLIARENLRPGTSTGWDPGIAFGETFIVVGDSAHVNFIGFGLNETKSKIAINNDKTLTLGGNINNISFTNIRFNSPNGKLMLSGGIGTIELVGENIIKEVEIDKTMTLKLNGTASLKTTSAGLKIATDSTTQFVKATLADGQYTYALADAKGAVSFNERENVYNFAAPQFAIANAAASSTVTVTIKNDQGATVLSQEATVGADGTVDILVGSAEDPQKPGLDVGKEYTYEVTVGGQTFNGNFYTMNLPTWFKADATSGESVVSGGSWDVETAPAVDTVAKVYTLDGESTFSVSGDKGASKLSYVKQKVTFTSAIEVGDLTPDILGSDTPTGAITIANDGDNTLVWYAYIGGEWKALYDTAAPRLNTEYTIRADVDRAANPKTISYVVNGRHLKDKDDNTVWNLADGAALTKVVFKGSGKLAMVEGVVPSTAVAKVGTTEYDSLEAALEDPNYGEPGDAAGGDAPRYGVELLTSVLWAPKVGTYYITKGVYDIKVVNEKLISWNDAGTVATVAVNETPIEGFVAPVEGGSTTPVGISGEWLNKLGTDGLTKKEIQAKLNETQKGAEMTNLEAYLLGVDAGDVATTKVTTTAVQNDDPKAITLALDGIRPRDRAETGVTVKVQVMAADDPTEQFSEQGEAVDGASATIDLPSTKVKYYRLKVKFE